MPDPTLRGRPGRAHAPLAGLRRGRAVPAALAVGVAAGLAAALPALRALPFALLLAALPAAAAAQVEARPATQPAAQPAEPRPATARPKVALVLSGGGARGLAHIGVLRVLEELRVPVDIVVGTSFGAIVGGAYAGGADVAELERLVLATDWSRVLQDRPPRDALTPRRREDDTLVSSRLELGVNRAGLTLPGGAFASGEVERLLRQLTPSASLLEVRQLPLVYRAVATDMLNGEMVTPVDVPLFTAMRASMSVPGAFAPITVDGRVLGDGGLVRNLPVDLARELGAEVVIAVNLGTPLGGPEVLSSAFGMAQQMIGILTEQNVQRSLRELAAHDVLVTPALGNADFLAFDRARPNIEAGAAAARAQAQRLAQWSVPAEAWAEYRRRRTEAHASLSSSPPTAAAVRVQALGRDGRPLEVPTRPKLAIGQPVTPDTLSAAAERVSRELDAERVETMLVGEGPSREVILLPIASSLAGSRLRLGLDLSTDFARNSEFTLSGLYTLGGRNAAGGEWRTLLRAGAINEVQTEWYQPLAAGSAWFASARIGYRGADAPVYDDDTLRPAGIIRTGSGIVSLSLGRRLLDGGQVRVGTQYRRLRLTVAIPDTGESFPFTEYSWFGDLRFDTLDSFGFPTRGHLLSAAAEYFGRAQFISPSTARYDSRFDALYAASRGAWAGHLYAAGLRSNLNLTVPLALGGFLRLSGTPPDALADERVAFGRAVLARQVGSLPAAVGGAVRVGLSLEAGKAGGAGGLLSASPLRTAGSVFTVVDTRFGPVYVGFGHTRHVGSSAYLFLGSVLLPSGLLR
ncbi:MAG: patatin-like phospholipase family protein [Rubrivivax sp.]|nr:patatin-like phospholipase family protein [Rubrivivax sp.]